jgi:hypothetical protein
MHPFALISDDLSSLCDVPKIEKTSTMVTEADLKKLTVVHLKDLRKARNLPLSGKSRL